MEFGIYSLSVRGQRPSWRYRFFFNNVADRGRTCFPTRGICGRDFARCAHTGARAPTHSLFSARESATRRRFDFSHSRRLSHKRFCWFELEWTRFNRLQKEADYHLYQIPYWIKKKKNLCLKNPLIIITEKLQRCGFWIRDGVRKGEAKRKINEVHKKI